LKRIITIQDISCVGRCSITVALPIISAAGVETAVLPTALLSTHTAFPKFTFRDLTGEIQPISDTFAELGIGFDAIYTGYLGSIEQLRLVEDFFTRFRTKDNRILVDPAMADEGKLYKGFTQEFADRMAKLCAHADLIVPNLTEASFLLREPYREDYSETYIRETLKKLTDLGAKRAALTGVGLRPGKIGCYYYDSLTGQYDFYDNERLPVSYHGTGDVFASSALAGCMRGLSIPEALHLAVDFTLECMKKTMADPDRRFYGVNFEQALPMLIERLNR
jgi:pyridoxine kinase